jgi:hypothetical protein
MSASVISSVLSLTESLDLRTQLGDRDRLLVELSQDLGQRLGLTRSRRPGRSVARE